MGLSQQPAQPANDAPSSSVPTHAGDLPPAALELAGKLFDFARQGKTDELAQYVSAGIPPNLTNHKGDTLLMLAAYHGHAETTKMLLDKGADPNVLNDRGQSPIAGAVFKGSDDVVRLLFERKADVYAGQPNAVDSAHMFRKEDYLTLFGVAQQ
ncbi:ankyrin [Aureobasidium sp. EXF-12298]|nr:ankyrin [Aureobasidium sp. EXF-12298]KAI4757036.1 ankyrin [Aureobasidium sp. EXF-12344]KAI4774067.1 ankyrin [Aureobasidium sp. EXF-3400]